MKLLPVHAGVAMAFVLSLSAHGQTAGEQAEQFTPEFREVHTTVDPKHSPARM